MKSSNAQIAGLFVIGFLAALSPSSTAFADEGFYSPATRAPTKPVTMNVRNYEVTPNVFYEIAYRALVKRGWTIEVHELTRLVGRRSKGDEQYKAEIRFAGDIISVSYLDGFDNPFKRSWLKNLAEDMKLEIKPLKRKPQVLPPTPPPTPAPGQ